MKTLCNILFFLLYTVVQAAPAPQPVPDQMPTYMTPAQAIEAMKNLPPDAKIPPFRYKERQTGGELTVENGNTSGKGAGAQSEGGEIKEGLQSTAPKVQGTHGAKAEGGDVDSDFWGKAFLPDSVKKNVWIFFLILCVLNLGAAAFFMFGPPLLRDVHLAFVFFLLACVFGILAWNPMIGVLAAACVLTYIAWPLISKTKLGKAASNELNTADEEFRRLKAAYEALVRTIYDRSLHPSVGDAVRSTLNQHGPNDGIAQDVFDRVAQAAMVGPFDPARQAEAASRLANAAAAMPPVITSQAAPVIVPVATNSPA